MQIKIDVLFIDIENKVCDFRKELVPWKPIVRSKNAVAVIELPAGVIEKTHTDVGDFLDLNAELSTEDEENIKEILPSPEAVIPMEPDINR